MESSDLKNYLEHGYDSRQVLEHYFSEKSEDVFGQDFLIFPIENLKDVFLKGHIKGDILIDLSGGPLVHHLYSACEFFKHIIVLKVKDRCILELKRWLDTRTGAFDWGHATKHHAGMKENSDELQESEGKVRSAAQHVMKCDLEKENIMDPMVLPPADCVLITWFLDITCRTKDDYIKYLRRFSRLLKPGGHIILFGVLGMSFYTVGKDKYHGLTYDEDFARKALVGEGFVIDCCKVQKRTSVSDIIDHKSVLFIAAHKEN